MSSFWQKQPSSRINVSQVTAIGTAQTQTSVLASTKFNPETYQVRIYHTLANTLWFNVIDSTGTSAAANAGTPIPGNQQFAEYFSVTPGQSCAFYSTSTSTGYFAVTEMS